MSRVTLANMIKWRKLRAYADDLVVSTNTLRETKEVIEAMKSLEQEWNLSINIRKSEILTDQPN